MKSKTYEDFYIYIASDNRLFIKAIIIIIIVTFSIPAILIIYHDFQITAEPEFEINHFSALVTLHVIYVNSHINISPFLYV